MNSARKTWSGLALALATMTAGCATGGWHRDPWKPGMPVTDICDLAYKEEHFAAAKQLMRTWLDGELRLHALSPTAMEELTNAPISPTAETIIWSYRFTPAAPVAGNEAAPAIDPSGYPVKVSYTGRMKETTRYLSLRVVTRDAIFNTPQYLRLFEPTGQMLSTSFFPTRLEYNGALFKGDAGLYEYSADTRERGFGFLRPTVNDDPDGTERIEITARIHLNWSYAQHEPGACAISAKTTLPLSPGVTLWDRLNRTFMSTSVKVRGGEFQTAPAAPAAEATTADMRTPESACAAGASEGCFRAAMMRLHPPQPRAKAGSGKQVAQPLPLVKSIQNEPARPEQVTAAREFLRKGCELGHGPACGVYGDTLRATEAHDKHDPAEALRAFARACQLDYGDGCTELARDQEQRKNFEEAERLFDSACRLGSGVGCYLHGRARERTVKSEQDDLERVARAYEKSCVYGVVMGCARYSFIAAQVRKIDGRRVEEGYNLACGGGLPWACNALGLVHADFVKNKREGASIELARQAFAEACKAGDQDGCANEQAVKNDQPLRPLAPPPEGTPNRASGS